MANDNRASANNLPPSRCNMAAVIHPACNMAGVFCFVFCLFICPFGIHLKHAISTKEAHKQSEGLQNGFGVETGRRSLNRRLSPGLDDQTMRERADDGITGSQSYHAAIQSDRTINYITTCQHQDNRPWNIPQGFWCPDTLSHYIIISGQLSYDRTTAQWYKDNRIKRR